MSTQNVRRGIATCHKTGIWLTSFLLTLRVSMCTSEVSGFWCALKLHLRYEVHRSGGLRINSDVRRIQFTCPEITTHRCSCFSPPMIEPTPLGSAAKRHSSSATVHGKCTQQGPLQCTIYKLNFIQIYKLSRTSISCLISACHGHLCLQKLTSGISGFVEEKAISQELVCSYRYLTSNYLPIFFLFVNGPKN